MAKKIDHIGIAVADIEDALSFWKGGLKLEETDRLVVPDQKVKTAFLPIGQVNIELLEGTAPDSPISKFIEKRGPGIHHICFKVEDIASALVHLKAGGFRLIDEEPRVGAHGKLVAFLHPKASGGVLIELSQSVSED